MGRRPKAKETSEDMKAMELANLSAQTALERKDEINARFLEEGETYSLNACLEKAKVYQEQMASGMLGLGSQLLLLKANEEHGNFLAAVENLGLAERSARYAMEAALKFGNRHTCADLSVLGNAKIRALTVLDDDEAKSLVEGDEVPGLGDLDDVANMTVKELKETIRSMREERKKLEEESDKRIAAVEKAVEKKERKITELEMAAAGRQPPTKEELAKQALAELKKEIMASLASMNANLDECYAYLNQAQETEGATMDMLEALRDGVGEFHALFDDKYQDFNQDMENIRPKKPRK